MTHPMGGLLSREGHPERVHPGMVSFLCRCALDESLSTLLERGCDGVVGY
jgi:hypothetical protein